MTASDDAAHPERIGDWILDGVLGRGGFATVYVAHRQGTIDARVALKVLEPAAAATPVLRERFAREASIAGRIDHPGLVRALGSGESETPRGSLPWLALELVEGESLRAMLARLGALPEPLVRALGAKAAAALSALHDAGIVHRDVKAENLVVTPAHEVKLVDLGIADVAEESGLTLDRFVGSPATAAPEQFESGAIGPATDLYSLGVVLLEAVTGINPFAGGTFMTIMRRHVAAPAPRAGEANAAVSAFLDALIAELLQKQPARRPSSAAEVARVLEEGESGPWWTSRASLPGGRTASARSRIVVDRRWPLLERDEAMQRILDAWSRVRTTGRGELALVRGASGMGRTRVLDAVAERAADSRSTLMLAACRRETGAAVDPIGTALRARFGVTLSDEASRRLHLSERASRRLADALGGTADAEGGVLSPAAVQGLTARLAESLCDDGPVAWLVDDLDAATPAALAALGELASLLPDRPVLIVATAALPSELAGMPWTTDVTLAPLSLAAVETLIAELAPDSAPRLARSVHAATDGVPLLVAEMLLDMQERDAFRTVGAATLSVPRRLHDVLASRVAQLADADRALLDVAAVHGDPFDPALVAEACARPLLDVLQALARLQRAGIVRADGRAFRLQPAQVANVLREELPPALGIECERALARALLARLDGREPDAEQDLFLAMKLLGARDLAAATPHALRAIRRLDRRAESERLIELADRWLALDVAPLERSEIHLRRGRMHSLLGDRAAQRRDCEAAARLEALAGAGPGRGAISVAAWCFDEGDFARCREILEPLVKHEDASLRTAARTMIARTCVQAGALDEAREWLGVPDDGLTSWDALGWLRCATIVEARQGRYDDALRLAVRLQAKAAEAGDMESEATASSIVATILLHQGLHDEAERAHRRALQAHRDIGDRLGKSVIRNNLGVIEINRGRLGAARDHLTASLRLARALGHSESIARALANLASVGLEECSWADAEAAAAESLSVATSAGLPRDASYAELHLSQVRRGRRRPADALAHATACVAMRADMDEPALIVEANVERARACLDLGDLDGARESLRAARDARESLDDCELGPVLDGLLALVGEREHADEVAISDRIPIAARAEAHALLLAAGAGERHRLEAERLLAVLGSHLSGERAERFRSEHPVHRRLAATPRPR